MFYSAICVTLAVFISLVHSQETVSTSTSEYELTVNITGTDPSKEYRLGYGTTPDNLTWVELAGGDAATYLLYPVIGLSPGVTYRVKVEKSGAEIYNQEVTTNPLPPVNILVTSAGTHFLTITWETDTRSTQDGGRVLLSSNGSEVMTFEATSGKQVNATNLQPGVRYSISVIALTRGKASMESKPTTPCPYPPL
ncbi:uncharacterized protein LOC128185198 [Crassostrea angulata]|uniref:uncharacterized protein LOC128185198 n=1 Tax=Magallana angulata TaxID=2784310 RepID=UPI0022B13685|nr:uncharacterized protein LOC128185198 [Crassostrea angulata]